MSMQGIIIGTDPTPHVSPSQPPRYVPRRLPNEFYPTPPEAMRALLSVETAISMKMGRIAFKRLPGDFSDEALFPCCKGTNHNSGFNLWG